jgi:uncharacterized membrane protein
MGSKIYQLFEYLYIVMAIFSIYVAFTAWSVDRERAYLFAFFSVVAVFMFFFKRKFRKKIEANKK